MDYRDYLWAARPGGWIGECETGNEFALAVHSHEQQRAWACCNQWRFNRWEHSDECSICDELEAKWEVERTDREKALHAHWVSCRMCSG